MPSSSSSDEEGVINIENLNVRKSVKTDLRAQSSVFNDKEQKFDAIDDDIHDKNGEDFEDIVRNRKVNLPTYYKGDTKKRMRAIYDLANISYENKKNRANKLKDTEAFDKNKTLHSDTKNHVMLNDGEKEINWSIRGTDPTNTDDIANDVHILSALAISTEDKQKRKTFLGDSLDFLNRKRLDKTDEIYSKLREKYPEHTINIAGHSLGGMLGKDILYNHQDDKNLRVFGINAAPHHHHDLNDKRYYSLRNKDDLVSKFEGSSYNKNKNAVQLDTYQNPLSAHSLSNWKNVNLAALHKPHNMYHDGL